MLGVVVVLGGFFLFVTTRLSAPNMELLYRGLDLQDSGEVINRLESMNIPYELRNNGSEVYVASSQVLKTRVTLAQEGLPAGGSLGYELFDRSQSLGTTSFVQNINRLRALEGELSRTIRTIDRVVGARVHLVLPKREVFSRDKNEPTASIILKMQGAARLDKQQVQAIQHLVAAAVPGLKTSAISIVDGRGTLLSRGQEGDAEAQAMSALEEKRLNLQQRYKSAIEELLQNRVGLGNVRAEVTVELDRERSTTNAEVFDPDGQVVRSSQAVEEQAKASESDGEDPVTVAGNLPEGVDTGTGAGSNSSNSRVEETTNFEISKTVKTEVHEAGAISRVSVAVLVNGIVEKGDNGERTYTPRSEEEIQQLEALVRSVIGYDEDRGDTIEIANMEFVALDELANEAEDASFLGLTKADYFRVAEMLVLTVVGVLVLLLVVRPLVSRGLTIAADAVTASTRQLTDATAGALPGPDGMITGEAGLDGVPVENLTAEGGDDGLDLDRIEGQVRTSPTKRIAELVSKHPEETVAIMRSWLYQDA
jgi:flagellar M-ring protein FliF